MLNVEYEDLEKISYKYEIKSHLGEADYGLDKESFDYGADYDLYPKTEWITKEQWDEFISKANFQYWLSFEDVLWESRFTKEDYRLRAIYK